MASLVCLPYAAYSAPEKTEPKKGFHDLSAEDISGKMTPFRSFANNVLLIVNTASQCGYTSQYKGLEALYQKYKSRGLVVMGFPSNDFGGQEPGSNAEVKKFCEFKFKVTFPMFSKANVTSVPLSPVYEFLTQQNPNVKTRKTPQWNFWKFLVDRKGNVVDVFPSSIEPESKELTKAIESALTQK
jgi:glutathione peroxidase